MLNIGCHLSSSKGFMAMGEEAVSIGANTFQFFTRNPRGGAAKAVNERDAADFIKFAEKNNFAKIIAHAPYTMNPCSADPKIREFTRDTMADDLNRMEYVPKNYYNFHPGSHVKQGEDIGIAYIAEMLNAIIKPEQTTIVLLETMSGKGTEIGGNFSHLRNIIDRVELNHKLGVCLDTCHIWDGGYNIIDNLDDTLEEFDRIIGIDRLKAVHLNDSKNILASHKDRHEKIGQGNIGLDALAKVINHPSLKKLPFILETPNELDGYAEEIKILRGLYQEDTIDK